MNQLQTYPSDTEHFLECMDENGNFNQPLLFNRVIKVRDRIARNICRKLLYDIQETDDVMQETYLKLFLKIQEKKEKFTAETICRAFIGYTKFMCMSFNERKRRFAKRVCGLTDIHENLYGMFDYKPEELLTEREHKFLDEQICNLPEKDMLILISYLDNDLKIYSTASDLELPATKTKARIRFIIRKLRNNINDDVLKELYQFNKKPKPTFRTTCLLKEKLITNVSLVAEINKLRTWEIFKYAKLCLRIH